MEREIKIDRRKPNYTFLTIHQVREKAIRFHRNNMYGNLPYIIHLDDVYNIAKQFTDDKALLCSCYLHDVLEDTECTYENLIYGFGKDVAEIVYDCTDELGRNRKERKKKTYAKTVKNPKAVSLKIFDRIANLTRANENNPKKVKLYLTEHKDFCKKLKIINSDISIHRKGYEILEELTNAVTINV